MALLHADDKSFDSMIKTDLALVDFWASWCGPCRMFGPTFEDSAKKHPNVSHIKFEITESSRQIPGKYGIRSIPSVLAFKNGNLIESRTGLMDSDTLDAWIAELKR